MELQDAKKVMEGVLNRTYSGAYKAGYKDGMKSDETTLDLNQILTDRGVKCKTTHIVLSYILDYIMTHGYAPSYNEIGAAVGLKSKSTVMTHMEKLREVGIIKTDLDFTAPRAYTLMGLKVTW